MQGLASLSTDYEFSQSDRDEIISLAQRLTGANPSTQPKIESILANISRRMHATSSRVLRDYLLLLDQSSEELAHFVSSVTIHTTSWFREAPHFDRVHQYIKEKTQSPGQSFIKRPFNVLSAGCSTGEEGYSLALCLEQLKQSHPNLDYEIDGWDVDPVSVAKANKAIYQASCIRDIPASFHPFLLTGTGKSEGYMTLDRNIRIRCKFKRRNLLDPRMTGESLFDIIFCRNVLIYFSEDGVDGIVRNLISFLKPGGLLCLGHSETIDAKKYGLKALGHSTFVKSNLSTSMPTPAVIPASPVHATKPSKSREVDLVLIGASTGGTEVLMQLVKDMPKPCPPIIVVQHIAQSFAKAFAQRLAESAGLQLGVPVHGAQIVPDHLYLPWDDCHLGLMQRGGRFYIELNNGPQIHSVRPSIDFLFQSAARCNSETVIAAALMTGMGKDGAKGLSDLRTRGSYTLVQDEKSSTVFGMPREAILQGAAEFVGNPESIRDRLIKFILSRRV